MRYLFAVYFNDFEKLKKIFGLSIVEEINRNLVEKFRVLASDLLERHQIINKEIDLNNDYLAVIFNMNQEDILLDQSEQMKALEKAGEEMIRKTLISEFGDATGRKIDFKVKNKVLDSKLDINADFIKEQTRAVAEAQKEYRNLADKRELESIIREGKINTYLQPIVDLENKNNYFAYEALTRGPTNSTLFSAGKLFSTASYYELTEQLELAAIKVALDNWEKIKSDAMLFLNVSPGIFLKKGFDDLILKDEYKMLLEKIVFEFTEHMPVKVVKKVTHKANKYRDKGVRFALDDVGCGFFDLRSIKYLRPEIVKICITVINKIDGGAKIQSEIKDAVNKMVELGSIVLAEGVEKESQLNFIEETEITLVQGYYFKKPFSVEEIISQN